MVHSCHLLPLSYWWKKICIEALRHCETICFWMPWQGSSGIPAACSYWRSRQLESGAVAVCSQSQFWEGSLKALCWFWLSEKVLLLCYFINLVSVQWPQYFILTRPFPPLWHNTSLLHPSLTSPCYVGMWLFLVSIWECGKKKSILLPIQLTSKCRLSSAKGVGSEGELALEVTWCGKCCFPWVVVDVPACWVSSQLLLLEAKTCQITLTLGTYLLVCFCSAFTTSLVCLTSLIRMKADSRIYFKKTGNFMPPHWEEDNRYETLGNLQGRKLF